MNDEALYSKLKDKLSVCLIHPVINEILDVLLENDKRGGRFPFWHCITLMKWSILNCSSSSLILLKKVNRKGIINFLKNVAEIEDYYHKQEMEKDGIDVFTQMHAIANQQLPFQRNIDKFTFSRQSLLYRKIIIGKSKLDEQFESITILQSDELLACMAFLHWINQPEIYKISEQYDGKVSQLFINTIVKIYGKEKYNSLMELLTLDTKNIERLRREIKNMSSIKNPIFHLFDLYTIASKPIIKISNQYRIIHRKLLNLTFRYLIYDKLKNRFKDKFTSEFGLRMEKYVKIGLDELNLQYKTEKQILKQTPENTKVVDFLVEDTIMIECKGIELHPMPRVSPTSKNLSNYLKGSIVKALSKQFLSVANELDLKKDNCYAIIITYKELNLGFGKEIIERIFSDEDIQNSVNKVLDSDRVFILELEQWDILLSTIKREKISFTQVLDMIRSQEQANRRGYISMHLLKLFGKNSIKLNYLDEEYELMMDEIKKSL